MRWTLSKVWSLTFCSWIEGTSSKYPCWFLAPQEKATDNPGRNFRNEFTTYLSFIELIPFCMEMGLRSLSFSHTHICWPRMPFTEKECCVCDELFIRKCELFLFAVKSASFLADENFSSSCISVRLHGKYGITSLIRSAVWKFRRMCGFLLSSRFLPRSRFFPRLMKLTTTCNIDQLPSVSRARKCTGKKKIKTPFHSKQCS